MVGMPRAPSEIRALNDVCAHIRTHPPKSFLVSALPDRPWQKAETVFLMSGQHKLPFDNWLLLKIH